MAAVVVWWMGWLYSCSDGGACGGCSGACGACGGGCGGGGGGGVVKMVL